MGSGSAKIKDQPSANQNGKARQRAHSWKIDPASPGKGNILLLSIKKCTIFVTVKPKYAEYINQTEYNRKKLKKTICI